MENKFGLIELVLVFGVALALMGYEWMSIRKSLRDDARKDLSVNDRRAGTRESD